MKKIGSLFVSKRKWFNHSEKEYRKIPVQKLKQWIKNTKRFFKMNKEKLNDRKITDFFKNNNNISVSKIGTSIQIKKIDQINQRPKNIIIILNM